MAINILCVGDVVGSPGRGMLADHLASLVRDRDIELVVCNAENAAGGSGLTPQIFNKLLHYGVDVVTLGDHVYRKREIATVMVSSDRIVRPANLSPAAAGRGWTVVKTKSGRHRVAVGCVMGQLYMATANSPWQAIDEVLAAIPPDVVCRVVDFHAEASGEKVAMGWHLNGRVGICFGTHTHVPTADARVLDGGTAYISDVGMTGPYGGVLGRKASCVLEALTTSMPVRFDITRDDPRLCGVLVALDPDTGKAESIERVEVAGRLKPDETPASPAEPAEQAAQEDAPPAQ